MNTVDPAITYGRARRLASRYCYGIKQHIQRIKDTDPKPEWSHLQLKNDWEIVVIFLTRLRRCSVLLSNIDAFRVTAKKCISDFDVCLPNLKSLRDYEEHFDDYSAGNGRKTEFTWGHLESYQFGSEGFSNGVGDVSRDAAEQIVRLVWKLIVDLEPVAKSLGYLSWDDRYGVNGIFRRSP